MKSSPQKSLSRFNHKDFFVAKILAWFAQTQRDLPWRKTHNPYKIWVSEIMLQQTQVNRVIDFYERFLKKFPTVQGLALATWEEFLPVWRGLGYYVRGRNMLKAANVLVEQYKGKFPRDVCDLEKLPGIGKYTARAIASFAFHAHVPVKDTNVSRVLQRFFCIRDENVWKVMEQLVPKGESSNFNQGVMELGALVCTAMSPKCHICPISERCDFFQSGRVPSFLVREPPRIYRKEKIPSDARRVAVGLIYRDGKILISRRRTRTRFAGLYEFPGGKLEPHENERRALKREVQEELGVEVSVRPAFFRTQHTYKGCHFVLSFHRCQILLGEPKPLEGQKIFWVNPHEIAAYKFPPANDEVLKKIPKMRW